MRALGPGSVSSLLKTALDVVYVVAWVAAVVVLLTLIGGLVLAPFAGSFRPENFSIEFNGRDYTDPQQLIPVIGGALGTGLLYLSGLVAIVGRLRRIFSTLIVGDPFHPDNIRRLQFIGAVLAALQVQATVAPPLLNALLPGFVEDGDFSLNLTSWFAVLVVFVLAEVFREGARLRGEAELTI